MRMDGAFYVLAWSILAFVFAWAVVPTAETMLFPVYSKFKVLTAEQTPDGVLATFEFAKNRQCEGRGLTWYLGEVGSSYSINVSTPDGTRPARPLGANVTSPYLIEGITLDDLNTQVVAQLRNQCQFMGLFNLPWISISEIYP